MATEIAEYSKTEAALAVLAQNYKGVIYDVTTREGLQAATKGRAELRTYRVDLEKVRKQIKEPALRRAQMIDSEARRITGEIEALERPIDEQIKREETRKEMERTAAIRAEQERIAAEEAAKKKAEEDRMAAERAAIEAERAKLEAERRIRDRELVREDVVMTHDVMEEIQTLKKHHITTAKALEEIKTLLQNTTPRG